MDYCSRGREVISNEITALMALKNKLGSEFDDLIVEIGNATGKVIIMGVGKSGNVGRKISATMSSLGTPSFFLDPTEAMHGSIGLIQQNDIIIMISNSGNTQEIVSLIPNIKIIGCKIVAITQNRQSKLYEYADLSYILPNMREADEFNLAPTSSTTVTLALGDALAIVLSENRKFRKEQFGLYHPAGTLGKRLITKVSDIMHSGEELPVVFGETALINVISEISDKKLGSAIVIDKNKKMIGIITSGDLRRMLEQKGDIYTAIAKDIMNNNPVTISPNKLAIDALMIMRENGIKISLLPVVDEEKNIIGIVSINDILKLGLIY